MTETIWTHRPDVTIYRFLVEHPQYHEGPIGRDVRSVYNRWVNKELQRTQAVVRDMGNLDFMGEAQRQRQRLQTEAVRKS